MSCQRVWNLRGHHNPNFIGDYFPYTIPRQSKLRQRLNLIDIIRGHLYINNFMLMKLHRRFEEQ